MDKKERLERVKKGEALQPEELEAVRLLREGNYDNDSDDEGGLLARGPGAAPMSANAQPFMPRIFRELHGEGRGEPGLARLMDMGMDIERLLQAGMGAGMRDLDIDDPLGLGSIFGVPPGHPPRELQRERERVNQANA